MMDLPTAYDPSAGQADAIRDGVFAVLTPVSNDATCACLCLRNNDDRGARYHLERVVNAVKLAASAFRQLESLTGRTAQ